MKATKEKKQDLKRLEVMHTLIRNPKDIIEVGEQVIKIQKLRKNAKSYINKYMESRSWTTELKGFKKYIDLENGLNKLGYTLTLIEESRKNPFKVV